MAGGGYRVRWILTVLVVAACLGLTLSGCGSSGAGNAVANKDLRVAISFLPSASRASYTFEFADWGPIEQELGYSASRLTAAHADVAFGQEIQRLTGGSPGGNTAFDLQPQGAGDIWSITDVLWDATEYSIGSGAAAPISITAFRNGSVIPHAEQHLARCGFRSRSVGGMTLYTGVALRCLSPTGTGIPPAYNAYAFDPGDRLVLQSASPTAVTGAIVNRRRNRSNATLNAILSRIGFVTQVAVGIGPGFCSQLANPATLAGRLSSPNKLARAEQLFSDTTQYLGFGFGYRYSRGYVAGQLVFAYPSESVARSDLSRRAQMLRNGIAFSVDVPYSKLFRVGSARTQGAAAIYQVKQPGRSELGLGTAFDHFDLGFARC